MARETKAQRLEREAAEHARALTTVLCWPPEPEPMPYTGEAMDLMGQSLGFGEVVRAYTYNTHSRRVTRGCFTRVSHNRDGDKTCSQTRGGPWFSTSREAALAMDWAICRQFAEDLLRLRSAYSPVTLTEDER